MAKRTNVVNLRNAQRERIEVAIAPISEEAVFGEAIRGSLRAEFLPLAMIAAIPSDNVDAFLREVSRHVSAFYAYSGIDDLRRQRKLDGFLPAADRAIRAIEYMQQRYADFLEEKYHSDCFFQMHDDPPPLSLADIKRELTDLRDKAKHLSTEELPKRGQNRTKILLKNIWLTAEKFGGTLTYDKHSERGTLVEVIEFFRRPTRWANYKLGSPITGESLAGSPPPMWADLSPSTLDRLRPR